MGKRSSQPVLAEGKLKKLAVLTSEHLFTEVSVKQMVDKFSKEKSTACQIQHFTDKETAMSWLLT